jgi:hypothetical protein
MFLTAVDSNVLIGTEMLLSRGIYLESTRIGELGTRLAVTSN